MKIIIMTGTGQAPTPLAAFDAALLEAGVGNYNLLLLSSVIPPASTIECGTFIAPLNEYGQKLYVVMACQQETRPGQAAWAGLGWTQTPDQRGLFVELHGSQKYDVETDIEQTLTTMITNRPEYQYGEIQSKLVGITCHDQPVCALVVAIYQSEGW